jgi:hypothetical protein
MTHRSRARVWVLVAGGLMAFGWIMLTLAVVTAQLGAALVFVVAIMLPVKSWWRHRQRKAGNPSPAILPAFVNPMLAAVAEWRASR